MAMSINREGELDREIGARRGAMQMRDYGPATQGAPTGERALRFNMARARLQTMARELREKADGIEALLRNLPAELSPAADTALYHLLLEVR
jgi:hypothetical protein